MAFCSVQFTSITATGAAFLNECQESNNKLMNKIMSHVTQKSPQGHNSPLHLIFNAMIFEKSFMIYEQEQFSVA